MDIRRLADRCGRWCRNWGRNWSGAVLHRGSMVVLIHGTAVQLRGFWGVGEVASPQLDQLSSGWKLSRKQD